MVKPKHFYARFDEEQTVMVKCGRTKKGYELSVIDSKPSSFRFLSVFLSFETRILIFSVYKEST